MNAIAYMLVTHPKTLLEHTQIPSPMETISHIIFKLLQTGFSIFLIITLTSSLITDLKTLFNGEEGEDPSQLRQE